MLSSIMRRSSPECWYFVYDPDRSSISSRNPPLKSALLESYILLKVGSPLYINYNELHVQYDDLYRKLAGNLQM